MNFTPGKDWTAIFVGSLILVFCSHPEYFMASGKKYSLLTYEKPAPPYIVFDLYNKEANTLRGCFVIKKGKSHMKIVEIVDCRVEVKSAIFGSQTYRYLDPIAF